MTHWVRGHAGHPENERCDQMAENKARKIAQAPGQAKKDVIVGGEA